MFTLYAELKRHAYFLSSFARFAPLRLRRAVIADDIML